MEAIEEFNKFRSPEAKAELLYIRGNVIVVKMSGTYCRSCGVYDYFEDLLWEFKDCLKGDLKILSQGD